jgi:5,10-methylenetetrahydromethanopterin reductase
MGQRPITLQSMRNYVITVRGLLAGETVAIDGQPARMLHVNDLAAPRPINVEIWLSVFGPRGIALATEIADGIIARRPMDHVLPIAMLMPATVLEPGEDRDSARVRNAVGPWKVVTYHEAYAIAGSDAVDALPGGRTWREALETLAPQGERHLFTHEGHVTHLTERDHQLLDLAPDGLVTIGAPDEVAARVGELSQQGVQEIIYTPSGGDVARELETFYSAASR